MTPRTVEARPWPLGRWKLLCHGSLPQQSREPPVGKDPAVGLAGRTVIEDSLHEADLAHQVAARWAGQPGPAVDRQVVEVGAGSGLNFAHYPREVSSVLAVEPEAHLRRVALRAARRSPVPIRVQEARAERLPLADQSVDSGVTSLVMCSVEYPAMALAELRRVIKVGGELRFYEHVRGGRLGGAIQDRADPLWSLLAGGCHLNRNTEDEIVKAGFVISHLRRVPTRFVGLRVPAPAVIFGSALRA